MLGVEELEGTPVAHLMLTSEDGANARARETLVAQRLRKPHGDIDPRRRRDASDHSPGLGVREASPVLSRDIAGTKTTWP